MSVNDLARPGFRKSLSISNLRKKCKKNRFLFAIVAFMCEYIGMKHSESGIKKVLKQMKKCPEVIRIERRAVGHQFFAKGVDKPLTIHWSAKAFHEIRRWCRKHTSIKNLKF